MCLEILPICTIGCWVFVCLFVFVRGRARPRVRVKLVLALWLGLGLGLHFKVRVRALDLRIGLGFRMLVLEGSLRPLPSSAHVMAAVSELHPSHLEGPVNPSGDLGLC